MSPADMNDLSTDLMSRLVIPHACKRNLDDFLLPEDDTAVVEMARDWRSKRSIQEARHHYVRMLGGYGVQPQKTSSHHILAQEACQCI